MTSPALVVAALAAILVLPQRSPAAQQGPPSKERIETYPDGKVKARYAVDPQGRKHGPCETFRPDGTLEKRATYVADQLSGSSEEIAANGTRTLQASYKAGLLDGAWHSWTEDGKKVRSCAYRRGLLHGRCEDFHGDGRPAAAGDYRDGRRSGKWTETDARGERTRTADYRDGARHGSVKVHHKAKLLTSQVWKDGELIQLDDLHPFPTPRETLRRELREILSAPPPARQAPDPLAAERHAGLRRLQAYRRLCGLPFTGMTLVPEWNLRCDAAAEVCRLNGGLDHTPRKPAGFDEARYLLAVDGAAHSNLSVAPILWRSIDSYMHDSDPTNIDRVGHRRWCLNPGLRKTGLGSSQEFHAMWTMDESGGLPKGLEAVYYPPRGYLPADLFDARRAFSIGLLRGSLPSRSTPSVTVRALDDDYLPAGEPLALDYCAFATGGFGGSPCLVFRPTGFSVEPGRKYLVEVSIDAGKTIGHRYVVEVCAAVLAEEAESGR